MEQFREYFPETFKLHIYLHCLFSRPRQLRGKQELLNSLYFPLQKEGLRWGLSLILFSLPHYLLLVAWALVSYSNPCLSVTVTTTTLGIRGCAYQRLALNPIPTRLNPQKYQGCRDPWLSIPSLPQGVPRTDYCSPLSVGKRKWR